MISFSIVRFNFQFNFRRAAPPTHPSGVAEVAEWPKQREGLELRAAREMVRGARGHARAVREVDGLELLAAREVESGRIRNVAA